MFGGEFAFKPKMESVFNMSLVGALEALTPVISPAASSEPVAASAHAQARRRLHISRLVQSEDDTRAAALKKLRVMVLINPNSAKLGRALLSFAGTLHSEPVLMQTFVDSFANKATGTLTKRTSSLWQFTAWLHSNNLGDPFSQTEENLYCYVCHMRSSAMGATFTSCSHFLEALGFADGVMGIVGMKLGDVLSARVRGVSHSMYLTKRFRKPAKTLSVDMVRELEFISMCATSSLHRLLACQFLFCILACCRWSDSLNIIDVKLEVGKGMTILEAAASKYKTSRSKEQQRQLLPFTAIGYFSDKNEPWAAEFVKVREALGMHQSPYAFMSYNQSSNKFGSCKMTTNEATTWLQELLECSWFESNYA